MSDRSVNAESLYLPLVSLTLLVAYRYIDRPSLAGRQSGMAIGALAGIGAH